MLLLNLCASGLRLPGNFTELSTESFPSLGKPYETFSMAMFISYHLYNIKAIFFLPWASSSMAMTSMLVCWQLYSSRSPLYFELLRPRVFDKQGRAHYECFLFLLGVAGPGRGRDSLTELRVPGIEGVAFGSSMSMASSSLPAS